MVLQSEASLAIQDGDQALKHQPRFRCTFTGIDQFTDLDRLIDLSARYSFVEWGILYSTARAGNEPRYMTADRVHDVIDLLPLSCDIAVHLCGMAVTELLDDNASEASRLMRRVAARNGRVQINVNTRQRPDLLSPLRAWVAIEAKNLSLSVITQHNEANHGLTEALHGLPNHAVLFDASGGRGLPRAGGWPVPLDGMYCGYAGGIGPQTIDADLLAIQSAVVNRPYWIDMEGRVRDEQDRFSLDAVEACLHARDAHQCGS